MAKDWGSGLDTERIVRDNRKNNVTSSRRLQSAFGGGKEKGRDRYVNRP